MSKTDVRLEQRFANFRRALAKLYEGVSAYEKAKKAGLELSELENEGIIQRFEFTHELAWNVLKDCLEDQGHVSIGGSKDATRLAFKMNLIEDGDGWMEMIKSRNLSSHVYDEALAGKILKSIIQIYHPLFEILEQKMTELLKK